MPSNEEGEFELVLGNKQLLSVFFLVVLLLGVFFSMGYIVGRSTAPAGTQMAANKGPMVVESANSRDGGIQPSFAPTTISPAALSDIGKPSPTSGTPEPKPAPTKATASPKPEPVKPDPPKPAKPEPVKPEPVKKDPEKKGKPAPAESKGGKGTYLQVAATKQPEADLLMESLKKKGFGVATMPVPDSLLLRVLVGPFPDAAALTEARQKLKDLGISGPIPRKL